MSVIDDLNKPSGKPMLYSSDIINRLMAEVNRRIHHKHNQSALSRGRGIKQPVNNINLKWLARSTGIPYPTICSYFHGKRPMTWLCFDSICHVMNISVLDLIGPTEIARWLNSATSEEQLTLRPKFTGRISFGEVIARGAVQSLISEDENDGEPTATGSTD